MLCVYAVYFCSASDNKLYSLSCVCISVLSVCMSVCFSAHVTRADTHTAIHTHNKLRNLVHLSTHKACNATPVEHVLSVCKQHQHRTSMRSARMRVAYEWVCAINYCVIITAYTHTNTEQPLCTHVRSYNGQRKHIYIFYAWSCTVNLAQYESHNFGASPFWLPSAFRD